MAKKSAQFIKVEPVNPGDKILAESYNTTNANTDLLLIEAATVDGRVNALETLANSLNTLANSLNTKVKALEDKVTALESKVAALENPSA